MLSCTRSAGLGFLCGLFCFLGAVPLQAQDRGNTVPRVSPNASVSQTVGVTTVEVHYGRPGVRDREIFGDLVPFGEGWRTGANEATTISFSTPVRIEGKSLDAGTYGFFTIPGPDQWTLIFNQTADQWGAYNYDSDNDILRVQVEPESAPKRERLTFAFHPLTDSTATAVLHWNETRVPFEISVNTTTLLRKKAEQRTTQTNDWRTPLQYVGYALDNEVLLEEALAWVNRSIDRKETFQNLRLKAYVLAKRSQFDEAVETANRALSEAENMDERPDGVDDLRSQIKSWTSGM
ncbi:MAG: hypothetical protein BRD35_02685 [Bacteroidetes bacterium QH_7_62_13]|nr:MAG: hypothetical protein BRD35_02685 [Bacteroidetes bacterium QH_7_62_13]